MLSEGRCLHPEVVFVTLVKNLSDGSVEQEEIGVHVLASLRNRNMARP